MISLEYNLTKKNLSILTYKNNLIRDFIGITEIYKLNNKIIIDFDEEYVINLQNKKVITNNESIGNLNIFNSFYDKEYLVNAIDKLINGYTEKKIIIKINNGNIEENNLLDETGLFNENNCGTYKRNYNISPL